MNWKEQRTRSTVYLIPGFVCFLVFFHFALKDKYQSVSWDFSGVCCWGRCLGDRNCHEFLFFVYLSKVPLICTYYIVW
ncbi:hypothetical protein BDY21DRAFT_211222 [Lineolata rhizophorae]|uniref:Uncharacterized protein n=1 Tax=Lineolata rhizophorae TaxID=578093 RepID=A0A6A6P446_9PEZI|nr:hypothetical protein BDY21DRAFT_211222 [Lineolata rhizophorae]